jgi:hypothetical protein
MAIKGQTVNGDRVGVRFRAEVFRKSLRSGWVEVDDVVELI